MIRDADLQFSNNQSVVGAAGATVASTNIIDLGVVLGLPDSTEGGGARDIGIGDDPAMKLHVITTAALVGGAGATLQIQFLGAPDNGAGAPGTFSVYAQSAAVAIPAGGVPAGVRLFEIDVPRPYDALPMPRYLELGYARAGAAITAGALTAEIVLDRFDQPMSPTRFAMLSGYPTRIKVPN